MSCGVQVYKLNVEFNQLTTLLMYLCAYKVPFTFMCFRY